jgi:hypothetical protein
MVAAAGPSGWAAVRFVLREAIGFVCDLLRCWMVPLAPLVVCEKDLFVGSKKEM